MRKKLLVPALSFALVTWPASAAAQEATAQSTASMLAIANQYICMFDNSVGKTDVRSEANRATGPELGRILYLYENTIRGFAVRLPGRPAREPVRRRNDRFPEAGRRPDPNDVRLKSVRVDDIDPGRDKRCGQRTTMVEVPAGRRRHHLDPHLVRDASECIDRRRRILERKDRHVVSASAESGRQTSNHRLDPANQTGPHHMTNLEPRPDPGADRPGHNRRSAVLASPPRGSFARRGTGGQVRTPTSDSAWIAGDGWGSPIE